MALENELAYFEENRAKLVAQHLGKYVVIKGDKLVGAFDTPQAAYEAAVLEFGAESFLMRQVLPNDAPAQAPALYTGLTALAG
jgi:hypothetical protein